MSSAAKALLTASVVRLPSRICSWMTLEFSSANNPHDETSNCCLVLTSLKSIPSACLSVDSVLRVALMLE